MLDIKEIRENAEGIKAQLAHRGGDAYLLVDEILQCDSKRREAETSQQVLQGQYGLGVVLGRNSETSRLRLCL